MEMLMPRHATKHIIIRSLDKGMAVQDWGNPIRKALYISSHLINGDGAMILGNKKLTWLSQLVALQTLLSVY